MKYTERKALTVACALFLLVVVIVSTPREVEGYWLGAPVNKTFIHTTSPKELRTFVRECDGRVKILVKRKNNWYAVCWHIPTRVATTRRHLQ